MIKKIFLIALFGSLSATYATLPDSAVANAQAWYQHYGATLSTPEQKECAEFLLGFQKVSYWTAAIKHAVLQVQHLLNDVKQILDPAEKRTIFIAMAAHMQRINDHTLKQYAYWLQRWAQAVEVIDKTQSHSLQEAITALQKAGQEVIFAALDQNQPAFAENAKEISEYLKQIMPVLTQSSQLSSTLFSSSSTSSDEALLHNYDTTIKLAHDFDTITSDFSNVARSLHQTSIIVEYMVSEWCALLLQHFPAQLIPLDINFSETILE